MRKRSLLGLAIGLVTVLSFGSMLRVERTPALADEPKAEGKLKPGEGPRAQEFIKAFNSGDAKAVASFWTEDGDYVDQLGHQYKGREALEKLYAKLFAVQKGGKLTIHVLSLRQLTPDVGIEDGVSEVTPADGGPPTSGRFAAVIVKRDGKWYFESVHETIVQPPSNAEHFEGIEWLLGDWVGEEQKGESATASYAWAENRNFIVSSFNTTLNNIPVVGGTQWIAWDAIEKKIRSFSFYSGGGFGMAEWTKDGDHWKISVKGQSAGGQKLSGTNIVTKVDNDHCTWQLTKLTVHGKEMPEGKVVKMKRVVPEQK